MNIVFVGIKLFRVRKYCKMMGYLSAGIKNVEENYFMGFYKRKFLTFAETKFVYSKTSFEVQFDIIILI